MIAFTGGMICYYTSIDDKYISLWISIPFTVSKALLDGWALEASKRLHKKNEHQIHKKYALTKLGHVRGVISGQYGAKAQIHALGELEVILTDVWLCCSGSTKTTYKKQKGIVAGYKNDINISSIDPNVKKPDLQKLLKDLQKIETTMRESES